LTPWAGWAVHEELLQAVELELGRRRRRAVPEASAGQPGSMSSIFTKRFLVADLDPGLQATATVPAGKVWIVKAADGIVQSVPGGSGWVVIRVTNVWVAAFPVSSLRQHYEWRTTQALTAGEQLAVSNTSGVEITCVISGYELTSG
jgi:hypothetical protein